MRCFLSGRTVFDLICDTQSKLKKRLLTSGIICGILALNEKKANNRRGDSERRRTDG